MLLRRRMSRLTRTTEKFVAGAPDPVASPVWDVHHPETERPDPAGQPAANLDRHLLTLVQSDLAAVEQDGRVAATAAKHASTRAAEGKQPPVLEEELPTSRERTG